MSFSFVAVRVNTTEKGREEPRKKGRRGNSVQSSGKTRGCLIKSMCWPPDSQADRLQQIQTHRHEQRSKDHSVWTHTIDAIDMFGTHTLDAWCWKWCRWWWGTFTGEVSRMSLIKPTVCNNKVWNACSDFHLFLLHSDYTKVFREDQVFLLGGLVNDNKHTQQRSLKEERWVCVPCKSITGPWSEELKWARRKQTEAES